MYLWLPMDKYMDVEVSSEKLLQSGVWLTVHYQHPELEAASGSSAVAVHDGATKSQLWHLPHEFWRGSSQGWCPEVGALPSSKDGGNLYVFHT